MSPGGLDPSDKEEGGGGGQIGLIPALARRSQQELGALAMRGPPKPVPLEGSIAVYQDLTLRCTMCTCTKLIAVRHQVCRQLESLRRVGEVSLSGSVIANRPRSGALRATGMGTHPAGGTLGRVPASCWETAQWGRPVTGFPSLHVSLRCPGVLCVRMRHIFRLRGSPVWRPVSGSLISGSQHEWRQGH